MDNLPRLLKIMQRLRDPEKGCPWDIQQSFASILPYTIEEVYEVADAIDKQDFTQLKDELGDLLFQIVYYTQMAKEQNLFDLEDVTENICNKLIRRHPHVFDKDNVQLQKDWEQIKQQERSEKSDSNSLLNDIPSAIPQLLRAKKIQKRVATIGFDWSELSSVIEKVEEELTELKEEINANNQQEAIAEELGDLLFSVVNLSRHIKVNAEEALRKSNEKFIKRFQYIEKSLADIDKKLDECSLEELEHYWQKAKYECA